MLELLTLLINKVKDIAYKVGLIADYVVEQGTSGIFTWEKWNSGKMEVWGRTAWDKTPYTSSLINGFYAYYGEIQLPVTFVDFPIVTYGLGIGSGFAIAGQSEMGLTKNSFRWYGLSTASGTQTCYVHFRVIGRWKQSTTP